jgi:WD40 repeat protein
VGEKTLEDYGGVLAAPPQRRPVRRILAWSAMHVLVLVAAIVAYHYFTVAEPRGLADASGDPVDAVSFTPDGRNLVVSDDGGCADLQNVSTGRLSKITCGYNFPMALSQDGKELAAGGGQVVKDDHLVAAIGLVDVATRHQIAAAAVRDSMAEYGGRVSHLAFSPDGRILAAASYEGHTYLWPVR